MENLLPCGLSATFNSGFHNIELGVSGYGAYLEHSPTPADSMLDLHLYDSGLNFGKADDLRIPDLPSFGRVPVEDIAILDTCSTLSSVESLESTEIQENIWSFPEPDDSKQTAVQIRNWETFYDKNFQESRNVYISEGGPRAFDALLAAEGKASDESQSRSAGQVIKSSPLLKSLIQLGLGRESALYHYSEGEKSFFPLIKDGRMSGYSPEAFQRLSTSLIDSGNQFTRIWEFIRKTQSTINFFPSLVALAASFFDIIATLQARLGHPSVPVGSLLQLQSQFERPILVLDCLTTIIREIEGVMTDEDILSRLYAIAQHSEHKAPWHRSLTLQILASASRPWLDCLSGWLGYQRYHRMPTFIRSHEATRRIEGSREMKVIDYELEPLLLPSFIAVEDAQVIFETGRGLRLLEAHQPEHPLLEPTSVNLAELGGLEWQATWKSAERIQALARTYESELQKAIKDFELLGKRAVTLQARCNASDDHKHGSLTFMSEESAKEYIRDSISIFEVPLPLPNVQSGNVLPNTHQCPDSQGISDAEFFTPPISLLPVLSFGPLISARASSTNRACLRLLFKGHHLRSHLSLLHRYSLFGDGVFASRLTHALFDPELHSTERHKGYTRAGTSGLRLGSRDTWPPASSELRLALMGILADSYYEAKPSEGSSSMFRDELPGGLSFAVREMSEDNLQRCMNPDSIEALDFLKLDYKPYSPLDAVITPDILQKYDTVFKLLLRATRMLFAVNQLYRDCKAKPSREADFLITSFRIQSHHFVFAICSYFCEGVQTGWSRFEKKLEEIEIGLDGNSTEGISDLHSFHVQVLDQMMFALMLRKRQEQVMKLLEEIFDIVLQFAKQISLRRTASTGAKGAFNRVHLMEQYTQFQKKVRIFVSVCKGLNERQQQGSSRSYPMRIGLPQDADKNEDTGNTVGRLLLKLDMGGFYERR